MSGRSGARVVKRPNLARPRKAFATATRETARQAGRVAKEEIRLQVPPPAGRGKFPGYAATGKLQAAVVAQEPVRRARAGDWEVRVGVQRTRKAAVYARIHNVGGIIRARRAPYLVFRLPDGRWIRTKQVRIRRKLWFTTGWQQAKARLQGQLGRTFRSQLLKELRIR